MMMHLHSNITISVITSLYKCEPFLEDYFIHVSNIENIDKNKIEILLLHNEPQKNELEIIKKNITGLDYFKHIIIPKRESLYTTWNKGIKLAQGEFIAIWNVDDIRTPNSLSEQATALKNNTDAVVAYGDMYGTKQYGQNNDQLFFSPKYKDKQYDFLRSHYIGCFPMWRKNIHESIGFFDEQFEAVADYEFQIRVARKYSLIKVKNNLGWYLTDGNHKLSSARNRQNIERTAVELRYGIFDKINIYYLLNSLKRYDIFNIISFKKKYNVKTYFRHYTFFVIIRLPFFIIAFIKFFINILKILKQKYLN